MFPDFYGSVSWASEKVGAAKMSPGGRTCLSRGEPWHNLHLLTLLKKFRKKYKILFANIQETR